MHSSVYSKARAIESAEILHPRSKTASRCYVVAARGAGYWLRVAAATLNPVPMRNGEVGPLRHPIDRVMHDGNLPDDDQKDKPVLRDSVKLVVTDVQEIARDA